MTDIYYFSVSNNEPRTIWQCCIANGIVIEHELNSIKIHSVKYTNAEWLESFSEADRNGMILYSESEVYLELI